MSGDVYWAGGESAILAAVAVLLAVGVGAGWVAARKLLRGRTRVDTKAKFMATAADMVAAGMSSPVGVSALLASAAPWVHTSTVIESIALEQQKRTPGLDGPRRLPDGRSGRGCGTRPDAVPLLGSDLLRRPAEA
jgi:hypothetical protein